MAPTCFPFTSRKKSQTDAQDLHDFADDATITSKAPSHGSVNFDSAVLVSRPGSVLVYDPAVKTPPVLSRSNSSNSKQSKQSKLSGPQARRFKWSKSDSSSTLVSPLREQKIDEEEEFVIPALLNVDSGARLVLLREQMSKSNIDWYIVPTTDDHQSEYVALGDRRRQWISGFTGSSGTAVISQNEAYLFTDSRYWVQAERELDDNWTLQRVGGGYGKDWTKWVVDLRPQSRVGIDSRMIAHDAAVELSGALRARGSQLVFPYSNLIDRIWKDQPSRPKDSINLHPVEFAGQYAADKLALIREWLPTQAVTTNGASTPTPGQRVAGTLLTSLSSIAWALNLRGSDIPYNPVFLSYLFISTSPTPGRSVLFTGLTKVGPEVRAYLDDLGITVREYNDVWKWLRLKEWGEGRVAITGQTPYAISCMLTSLRYVVAPPLVEQLKALKNETEVQGFDAAYHRDGAAIVRWLAWLEQKVQVGFEITEWEAVHKLTEYRRLNERYMGLAYENISASGPNAALPHYSPSKISARPIDRETPYLFDTGGQYLDGTCDTTRTVHFGRPTDEQCDAFTRVLQGHIAIDQVIFPDGTTGAQLDVLARKALWRDGLTYLHGTGHGVGSFLNVHEGPQSFSSSTVLEAGHILTNEPGVYKEGSFGVRIESALVVERVEPRNAAEGSLWLGFRRLTCVPIQVKMVKGSLLTKEERAWLQEHNRRCRAELEPLLQGDKRALKWLKRETERQLRPESGPGVYIDWD